VRRATAKPKPWVSYDDDVSPGGGGTMSKKKYGTDERNFWVVSPNVDGDYHTVKQWKREIIHYRAAFMGWPPQNKRNGIGSRFAYKIKSGDVILIARRWRHEPDIVGFGIVRGRLKMQLRGFKPPGGKKLGSLWKLSPFIPRKHLPRSLDTMSVLGHTFALRKIRRRDHTKICNWLERQLFSGKDITRSRSKTSIRSKSIQSESTKAMLGKMPQDKQLEYMTRTREAVSRARKLEAELLAKYCNFLEAQGRILITITTGRLRCDGYEHDRGNLIEAKSRTAREYIRMAVGQLFDYAFLGRNVRKRQNLAILLPNKPSGAIMEWLKSLKISAIWLQNSGFKDNAEGWFCSN
jgi:hypothetical protein